LSGMDAVATIGKIRRDGHGRLPGSLLPQANVAQCERSCASLLFRSIDSDSWIACVRSSRWMAMREFPRTGIE
jgi:hypothetical protein